MLLYICVYLFIPLLIHLLNNLFLILPLLIFPLSLLYCLQTATALPLHPHLMLSLNGK